MVNFDTPRWDKAIGWDFRMDGMGYYLDDKQKNIIPHNTMQLKKTIGLVGQK